MRHLQRLAMQLLCMENRDEKTGSLSGRHASYSFEPGVRITRSECINQAGERVIEKSDLY